MNFSYRTQKIKSKFLGSKAVLLICDAEGEIIDRVRGIGQGIKKASFWDRITFQSQGIILDGKKFRVKKKSLNQYLVRNGTHLLFDRYSRSIHYAVSKGFKNAIRFIPRKGIKKKELAGQMLLKCSLLSQEKGEKKIFFKYDDHPKNFKKNYKNPLKWENFFIELWSLEKKDF